MRVERGAFLDAILGPAIDQLSDPRDAALLTRLAYGVETWRARLDWTAAGFARRRIESFEPAVRSAVRLGLFQLFFLDRVPTHAAVDTSVELAKRSSPAGAKLVNALLRRAAREGERALPEPTGDLAPHLALRWSHPEWLVRRWLDERGQASTEALLAADTDEGPSAFRVDRRRTSREAVVELLARRDVVARPSPFVATGLVVEGPVSAVSDVEEIAPQGIVSQIVAQMVAPPPGGRVLDLCAAPGGKASALAETHDGVVVASDRAKGGIRRAAAARTGRPGLIVLRADGTEPPFAPGTFDALLVDAPCSGLGTLRSHPELRWRRAPEDVRRLAALQRRLLGAAQGLVRHGGRLVYATCTLVREENEDTIEAFLAEHPAWRREDPSARIPDAARFIGADLALRTSPDRDGLDGFFAVSLVRG